MLSPAYARRSRDKEIISQMSVRDGTIFAEEKTLRQALDIIYSFLIDISLPGGKITTSLSEDTLTEDDVITISSTKTNLTEEESRDIFYSTQFRARFNDLPMVAFYAGLHYGWVGLDLEAEGKVTIRFGLPQPQEWERRRKGIAFRYTLEKLLKDYKKEK